METVWNLILGNWQQAVLLLFFVLAMVLVGRRLLWWQWFNEVAFFAWDSAEKKGLLEGLKGMDKLRHYIEVYRSQYIQKWGTPPTEGTLERAVLKAAELSAKEKVIRLSDPT